MFNNIPFNPTIRQTKRFKNLTGQNIGRLTVISLYARTNRSRTLWLCRCECGKFMVAYATNLTRCHTMSCGCLRKDAPSKIIHGATIRGKTSCEYRAYWHAKMRCENPNVQSYPYYGGRGIEFRFTSFPEFLTIMGIRPSQKHSLDRIDTNGHYEIGNVKWSDAKQQNRNRSITKNITIGKDTKPLGEWCEQYAADYGKVWDRINQLGWCALCALSENKCIHK